MSTTIHFLYVCFLANFTVIVILYHFQAQNASFVPSLQRFHKKCILPGQVVISQKYGITPGATWLGTDPSNGRLIAPLFVRFGEECSNLAQEIVSAIENVTNFYAFCKALVIEHLQNRYFFKIGR